ncbi:MAG: 6-carboxytetrahydropterin synthase [Sphaerobacteraceae bacterium]|nr:MAG: 6-carboxytetrahydropterin synthase [Sphaerobacteraceae bacterium]
MYSVAVSRDFVAQHFLIGGDWGPENDWHSHHYRVEVRLDGETLDQHNYLVDIVEIETALEELVAHFRDKTLNQMPEFSDQNPSIELFSQRFATAFAERVSTDNISAITVTLWENEIAWASYRLDRV